MEILKVHNVKREVQSHAHMFVKQLTKTDDQLCNYVECTFFFIVHIV